MNKDKEKVWDIISTPPHKHTSYNDSLANAFKGMQSTAESAALSAKIIRRALSRIPIKYPKEH